MAVFSESLLGHKSLSSKGVLPQGLFHFAGPHNRQIQWLIMWWSNSKVSQKTTILLVNDIKKHQVSLPLSNRAISLFLIQTMLSFKSKVVAIWFPSDSLAKHNTAWCKDWFIKTASKCSTLLLLAREETVLCTWAYFCKPSLRKSNCTKINLTFNFF